MGAHDTWHYSPRIPTAQMIGRKYNRLTVLRLDTTDRKAPDRFFVCQCDCGNITSVRYSHLIRHEIKSCGCLSRENHAKKHGKSHTRLYGIWSKMRARCLDDRDASYAYYGQRGIQICDEWRDDFMSFYTWAMQNGYEEHLTLDRINVNGNYTPDNCRWVTYAVQARNRTDTVYYTYQGETMVLTDWAHKIGMNEETLRQRVVDYGMSLEDAINTPLKMNIKRYEYRGKLYTLSELAKQHGLSYGCVWRRLTQQHWSLERALTTPVRQLKKGGGTNS